MICEILISIKEYIGDLFVKLLEVLNNVDMVF